ncbi:MAG TPA: Ig-like domain-containing protein, partial [Myxococcales bacterium]|nr:Ig-like domain-containing protein [Myxococcales bacterium]
AAAEIYDEAFDAWSPAGALASARAHAAAILLTDGRVLVAGGSAASGSLSSAELYEDTGASDAWRPSFAAIPPLYTGEVISVSGSRFRGISEGSNGSWAGNSPANVPVVQLLPLQGGALPVPVQSFSDTSLTLTIPSVSEGYYLLSVTVNAIPVAAVVFIDGPPAAPVLTAPGPVVASSRPLIAGIAEAGSTVTVSLDGSSLGAASTDSSGAWSIIPASALMDGPHVIAARATDAIGAAGAWSPPRSFTVDTMAPASPVLTDPGTFTGTRPVLSGTSEPASRVTLRVDGVVAGTTGASATGQWSVGIASPLAEGLHAATAQAEDAAGNSSPISAARSFTVDSVPPPPPVIVSPGSGASISSRTPVISGTAEGNSSVTVAVDGYLVGVAVADASGAWSCQSTLSFTQGAHSLTAQAQDAAGNQGPATSPSLFTVDSTPPAPPILLTPAESAIESSDTPLISGTAEVGSRVTVWLDGVSAGATGTTDSGTWSFFPSSPLETGPHTVLVQATDAAGNDSSTTGVRSFTVQPPTPMVPQILSPNGIVATAFPRITGRAGSEDSVDVLVDGALAGTASTDQTGSWSLAISSALADGQHSAAARARDARLNASPLSSPVTFVVDTIAPPAPWLETPGAGALLKDAAPELAGSAEPGSTVSVVLDSEVTGTPKAGESGAWTFTPPKPLADGLHTVTLQATDAAGNVSPPSDLRSFTVQRPRSFYGSGCSAAPSRSLGAWWLLLALCAMASRRRRRQRVPGLQGRQPRLLPLYRTLLGINMDLTSAALGIQGGTVCVVSERLVAGAGPGGGG